MVLTHLLKGTSICGGNSGYGLSPVANPSGTGAQQFASPTSQQGWEPGDPARNRDVHLEKRWNKTRKGTACLGISPEWLPLVKFWQNLEAFLPSVHISGNTLPTLSQYHILLSHSSNSWVKYFCSQYVCNFKFNRFSINWWLLIFKNIARMRK